MRYMYIHIAVYISIYIAIYIAVYILICIAVYILICIAVYILISIAAATINVPGTAAAATSYILQQSIIRRCFSNWIGGLGIEIYAGGECLTRYGDREA